LVGADLSAQFKDGFILILRGIGRHSGFIVRINSHLHLLSKFALMGAGGGKDNPLILSAPALALPRWKKE